MRQFINIVENAEDQIWYHGSEAAIEAFSYDFVGRGNDQLGSGFYFTSNKDDALMYGPILHRVKLRLRGEVSREKSMSAKAIRAVIEAGDPETLWDFGDLGSRSRESVLASAVEAYSTLDAFNAMICLSNDWYRGNEGEFLKVFVEATGCNHARAKSGEANHVVMFDADDIEIIS